MRYREFGRTGWRISEIGFGAWAIGGSWGRVDEKESMAALHRAVDRGVNFFDSADVYGDGTSERLLGRLRRERRENLIVATKAGRRLNPHLAEGYDGPHLNAFVDRSLRNLAMEPLDLLQLHCPPTAVYSMPEVFAVLDDMVRSGKIRYYGVSVEKIEEALKALEYPGVQSVQIIFNMFRLRPSETFFERAKQRRVSVLARVPLASGLLTGKMVKGTVFDPDDHRTFNRGGEAFDPGETFSGVDFETGLAAVEELRTFQPPGTTMGQFALRWILMFDAVTCAIPGAKRPSQVEENPAASELPPLSDEIMNRVRDVYDRLIRDSVHSRW